MKTVSEIRIEALRIIDNVIRLQHNVNYGCSSDEQKLESEKNRLIGIKKWAAENNQIMYIRNYFASHCFGHSLQFIAADLSKMF